MWSEEGHYYLTSTGKVLTDTIIVATLVLIPSKYFTNISGSIVADMMTSFKFGRNGRHCFRMDNSMSVVMLPS